MTITTITWLLFSLNRVYWPWRIVLFILLSCNGDGKHVAVSALISGIAYGLCTSKNGDVSSITDTLKVVLIIYLVHSSVGKLQVHAKRIKCIDLMNA